MAPGIVPISRQCYLRGSRRGSDLSSEARQHWFGEILRAGLEEGLFGPVHLLAHISPETLAQHLPPEVLGAVLAHALEEGAMTPETLIEKATPEVLAETLPHELLWACIAEAAERAGLRDSDRSG